MATQTDERTMMALPDHAADDDDPKPCDAGCTKTRLIAIFKIVFYIQRLGSGAIMTHQLEARLEIRGSSVQQAHLSITHTQTYI